MKKKTFEKGDGPRDKLKRGAGFEDLSDEELLMLLIGSGVQGNDVKKIATELSKLLDKGWKKVKLSDIEQIKGVGKVTAGKIYSTITYWRRRIKPEEKISGAQDVRDILQPYKEKKQEMFFCITLNGAHEVIEVRTVTVGLVNRTQVHPREVFADAITDRACAIIIAHNHPSGNLQPSREDIAITERIRDVGELLGIKLLDHVIISKRGYYSFAEHGHL